MKRNGSVINLNNRSFDDDSGFKISKRSFSALNLHDSEKLFSTTDSISNIEKTLTHMNSGYSTFCNETKDDEARSILSMSFKLGNKVKSLKKQSKNNATVTQHQNENWTMSLCERGNRLSKYKLLSKSLDSFSKINSISTNKLLCYDSQKYVPKQKQMKWENPVIGSNDQLSLPSTCSTEVLSRKSFKKIYSSFSFTKDMLKNVNILGQIESKFIACVFRKSNSLVLVDQHAAHERIRLEKLLNQIGYYTDSNKVIHNQYTKVFPPLKIEFPVNDFNLLIHYKKEFEDIGVSFTSRYLREKNIGIVYVNSIPSVFANASESQPVASGTSLNRNLIKEFMFEQLNTIQSTNGKVKMSSSTIFKALASYSCHGAIKFGDPLKYQTCVKLMNELSKCYLPFQCAHGRPSLSLLLKLDLIKDIFKSQDSLAKPNLKKLREKI